MRSRWSTPDRGPADKIGVAVQPCTLLWLAFVSDDLVSALAAAVARLSEQVLIPVGELQSCSDREQTRTVSRSALTVSTGGSERNSVHRH